MTNIEPEFKYTWLATFRIDAREKTVETSAETEWKARKIAHRLKKEFLAKGRVMKLLSFQLKEEESNGRELS
jgi:hypothetical protein